MLGEIDPRGASGLTSAEVEQLLANSGQLGHLAIALRSCDGVDGPYYIGKVEVLLRQDDCGLTWGFAELTVNGGLSYWNYLAIDLPVGQLVMCDHSQTRKVPEYPGTIRDYGAIRDFDGARALRHAFVEWVYNRTEAVRN